jgi:hypothetical protein
VKRRWRVLIGLAVVVAAVVLAPIGYIEGTCRTPVAGFDAAAPDRPILPVAQSRPEARTFLTYPEWHIVYEAESFARHLAAGGTPSSFAYGSQIKTFWTSYCQLNRVTRGSAAAGDAKVMIYTIGISYTVELAVKAAYEKSIGRLIEWIDGATSTDDRYAAQVQASYGHFMHETPWYRFPFGQALRGLWRLRDPRFHLRHWERHFALTAEYGVKAVYAKAIDKASGATLGHDQLTLRFIAKGTPADIGAVDPRLRPVAVLPDGLTVVEAPRYQQFNDLLAKLAATKIELVEIAGNDDIFATLLLPAGAAPRVPGRVLLQMPLEQPGIYRTGVTVKVPALLGLLRATPAAGGTVEHVYDY